MPPTFEVGRACSRRPPGVCTQPRRSLKRITGGTSSAVTANATKHVNAKIAVVAKDMSHSSKEPRTGYLLGEPKRPKMVLGSRLPGAKLPITRVAEARHDIALIIQVIVNRGEVDLNIGVRGRKRLHPFRRGD